MNRFMPAQTENHSGDSPAGEFAVSEFIVRGMNCQNCARHVTEAIEGVAAVARAEVRLEEGRATVHWNPRAEPDVERVVSAIKLAGYDAAPVVTVSGRDVHASDRSPMAAWKFTVIFGVALTLPL